MTIRKVADIKIKASAYGRMRASGTGMKFYSYDKNSAAIDFHFFDQDNKPTDLMNAKVSLLLLTEENGEWKEFTIIDNGLEVLSEMEGTARYIIPDNLRGYIGTVQGYVYLNYNDGSRSDECYFDFKMERSKIEEEFESAGGYYIKEIEDSLDEVIAHLKEYAQEKIVEYNEEFADLNAQILAAQNAIGKTQTDVTALNAKILELQNKQSAIEKLIADNDVATKADLENAKAESSANVVYQIIGKEKVRMLFSLDFLNKVAYSIVENANWAGAAYGNGSLPSSASFTSEVPQIRYDQLKKLDNNVLTVTTVSENQIPCLKIKWNVVEYVKNVLGENFFTSQGAVTLAEQISLLKKIINGMMSFNAWGTGSFSGGYNLTITNLVNGNWQTGNRPVNSTNTIKKISALNSAGAVVNDDGTVVSLVYTEKSTADLTSKINVDYASLSFEIEVSANEYLLSLIAQNHVENLATQAEAEAGTDNAKTMTPLRTSQQIDKKSVTLASNQTVGGIKDFKDGLLLNGTSVVTDQFVFKTVATANTTDFTPESSVTFQRWGRMVVANVSITNKDANFAGWKTLMQFPAGYAPSQRAGWGGALTNMSNRLPALSVYANAAGIQVMPTATDLAKEQSCSGSVAYFTKDAWPS